MYTQCPDCQVTFKVTAEVLQQARGRVRCGNCGEAFNALDHLSESPPVSQPLAPPDPETERKSQELLNTLNQMVGPEDIRIEDTGIEWRVVDDVAPPGDSATGEHQLADDEPRTGSDTAPDQGDDTPEEELRYDDNTPLPDDFEDDDDEQQFVYAEATGSFEFTEPADGDVEDELDLSEPDEWTGLLDDVDVDEDDEDRSLTPEADTEDSAADGTETGLDALADDSAVEDVESAETYGDETDGEADEYEFSDDEDHELEPPSDEQIALVADTDKDVDVALDGEPESESGEYSFGDDTGTDDEESEPESESGEYSFGDDAGTDDDVVHDEESEPESESGEYSFGDDAGTDGVVADDEEDEPEAESGEYLFSDGADATGDEHDTGSDSGEYAVDTDVGEEESDEHADDTDQSEEDDDGDELTDQADESDEDELEWAAGDSESDSSGEFERAIESAEAESDDEESDDETRVFDDPVEEADDSKSAGSHDVESDEDEQVQNDIAAMTANMQIDPEVIRAMQDGDFDAAMRNEDGNPLVETIIMEGDAVRDALEAADTGERRGIDGGDPASLLDTYISTRKPEKTRRAPQLLMIIGSVVLTLALAGQYVHSQREDLATHPWFAGAVAPIYESMGMPVTPYWDIKGWRFEATSGSTGGSNGDLLTISSRVSNRSSQALPYPLVHVSLTDRYQEIIGSRILEPADYLAESISDGTLVSAGGNFTATITIADTSAEATGFNLNVCYPEPGNRVRCAIEDFKER